MQNNLLKYWKFGTSLIKNKGNTGISQSIVINNNVETVQVLQEKDLQVSEQQNGLGFSASTFICITCSELKWCLYHICVRNQLTENKF